MNESRADTERVPEPPESTDGGSDEGRLAPAAEALKEALTPGREHEGVWFPKVQQRLTPARRPA